MSNEVNATATKPAFSLPTGVVEQDGKLVDNRPFYKTRITHDTLATIEKQWETNKAQQQAERFTWKTPFVKVYNLCATVLTAIADAFKGLFNCINCFGKKEAEATADEAKKAETPKAEKK